MTIDLNDNADGQPESVKNQANNRATVAEIIFARAVQRQPTHHGPLSAVGHGPFFIRQVKTCWSRPLPF